MMSSMSNSNLQLMPVMQARPVPAAWIDYDQGIITVPSFDSLYLLGGGTVGGLLQSNAISPSLPVWVFLDNVECPIDWSTWGPAQAEMSTPIPAATGDSVDLSGWNNLLWYYVVPPYNGASCGGIHSSPVVVGDKVYFETDNGILYQLNAETGESGGVPTAQTASWVQPIGYTFPPVTPKSDVSPAGSSGVLLVPGGDGLHAFTNATTLVADTNRVLELDGAGNIAWSLSSISWPESVPVAPNQSSQSSYTPPPGRDGPIDKPARAKYLQTGEILIVNSGTSQVCKVDKSGRVGIEMAGPSNKPQFVRWIFDKFTDPKRLLRPGQPTQLLGPSDAQFWQETEAVNGQPWLVYHCVVADSGNHRIVDLVYRVNSSSNALDTAAQSDPENGFYLPELNWVTGTDSSYGRYIYDCVQLVPNPTTQGMDIWAVISNYKAAISGTTQTNGGLGGAIVQIRYRTGNGTNAWDYSKDKSTGQLVAASDHVLWGSASKPFSNPRSFQVLNIAPLDMLIADDTGVFEATYNGSALAVANTSTCLIDQAVADSAMVWNSANYRGMLRTFTNTANNTADQSINQVLGVPLVASSVQQLPNKDWLIVNSYTGTSKLNPNAPELPTVGFSGEVFEYNPAPRAFPNTPAGWGQRIVWSSPSLEYTNTGPAPNPNAWLNWFQSIGNGDILETPRSAMRNY